MNLNDFKRLRSFSPLSTMNDRQWAKLVNDVTMADSGQGNMPAKYIRLYRAALSDSQSPANEDSTPSNEA